MNEDDRVKSELLPGWTLYELQEGLRNTVIWVISLAAACLAGWVVGSNAPKMLLSFIG